MTDAWIPISILGLPHRHARASRHLQRRHQRVLAARCLGGRHAQTP